MKTLKQLFFLATIVIGLSMSASAQKDQEKPKPPKDPPVINPGDKKPPKEKPDDRNNDNRGGKKPQIVFIKNGSETTIYFS